MNDLMNELLEVEPISGYQERSRIARRPGVYLYSELRSAGLVHLYVGQSGSPNGGIYGCYCQENNLCTPRREEGSRWRGGTSLPAAPAVTNAAMDELQRRGVRVPRDRTALFRNDPEAYEEWCRQASRFRAAEFLAGWRSSTTWSGRALKCMPFGNFVDRAMICTTGPCDQSARTVPHDSKGTLPVSLGRRNHRLGGSPARGVPRRSALRLVHRRGGGIPRRRVCGPDATPSEARVGQ